MGKLAHTFIGGGTPATNNIEFWDGSIPWLQSSDLIEDIVFNIIPRKFISKKALKKSATKLIPSNSITIVTRVGVGKLALIPYEFATSQDFISFSELKLDLIFASYAFYRLMKEESKSTQGTSIKGITKEVILNKYIYVPKSKEEQTQIGNFFKQLDDTIALHQREFEKFKILRKAYLKHIFIDNTTQFRAEKTIPWEQRKLGELGYCQSGIGFPELEQGGKTGIPFYKVSDMNLLGNEIFMESSNNYVSINQITNKKWKTITSTPAVIFAKVGAALMLDRKRLVLNEFLIDNNTMAYIFDDSWHYYFGKTLFDKTYLPQLSQTGALPSFNAKDVEELNVILPTSKEEQTQIGNFFKQLDDTISLHQKELAKYQQIKAACLEKMFVE
ncbi:restriction endonuclease subunit S [Haemophilus parahaemolyticus]|uniref:restriction endonuclease subunit S n=1 Tax=Haemophilus parahaemolyticus TaxID=735 RepID=UPI0036F42848